jgi:hypothetical protein
MKSQLLIAIIVAACGSVASAMDPDAAIDRVDLNAARSELTSQGVTKPSCKKDKANDKNKGNHDGTPAAGSDGKSGAGAVAQPGRSDRPG